MSEWNTIESDAGVFTELVEKIGVKDVEFEELLSIDVDSLSQIAPLYGVVFLFKYRASSYSTQQHDGEFATDIDPSTVFFAHQRIQNACATQAVLSILLNCPEIDLGPELSEFKLFTQSFDPELKGDTITNSDTIRNVHNSFSRPTPFVDETDRQRPSEDDDGLFHFVAYVPVDGILYELDGLQPYPISHGPCINLPETLSQVLEKRISRAPAGEMLFNLLAATKDKRLYYQSVGDSDGVANEEAKRLRWKRENALRRENFLGLIAQLLKGIASTTSDEEWEQLLEQGRQKTQKQARVDS